MLAISDLLAEKCGVRKLCSLQASFGIGAVLP